MLCPNCGTRNNYYHRYCYYCGYKLVKDREEVTPYEKEHSKKPEIDQPTSHEEMVDQLQIDEKTADQPLTDEEKTSDQDLDLDYLFKTDRDNIWNDEALDWFFEEPEYMQQFPLRRHRKDKGSTLAKRTAKICTAIMVLAVFLFISYIMVDQIWRSKDKTAGYGTNVIASTSVEATTIDGKPAHKIIVNASNGESVEVLGKVYPVIDGKAEIVYEDAFLYSYFSQGQKEDEIVIELDITIHGEDLPDTKEKVTFTLTQPLAPLTLIHPESDETMVEGKKYRIILEVEPGSQVLINGNNYSDLVDEEGRLEKEVEVPDEPENVYEIRVSTPGYADHIRYIVLKREVMEVPLTIDQPIPVQTSDSWAKITGTTHPQAVLEASLETRSQPTIDPETGNFTLYVKANASGYTPCTITARVEGQGESKLNLVIERLSSESEYTRRAWALDYDELKSNPELHNGRIFVFEGIVKDIIALGDKSAFTVDVSSDSSSEQLVYVEHWNGLSVRSGNKVRIFGNRWGNHEGIPRILAKYVYRR